MKIVSIDYGVRDFGVSFYLPAISFDTGQCFFRLSVFST
ncbi:MAG: hypothetical protein ACJAZ2_001552 [Glaciecola sp.]|jgi:hypothetical protein